MILRSLTFEDVGTYAGRQTLDFAPPDPRRPITLVGGLNGAGKTTIIRSLFHALYGRHALSLLGRRGSYERFLRDVTHRGKESAALELRLTIPGGELGDELALRRSWEPRKSRIDERLDVFRDGTYDEALSEAWEDVVETFAPRKIARLFFFDGEQVEALADLESASGTLRAALGGLLGLDVVDQLGSDLAAVERRVVKEAATKVGRERLEQLENHLAAARQLLDEARRERDELSRDLTAVENDHTAVEEAYRAAGGDLHDGRAELESSAADARIERDQARSVVVGLAANAATPLLMLPELLEELRGACSQHPAAREHVLEVLVERDAWLIAELQRLAAEPQVSSAIEAALEEDRSKRSAATGDRLSPTAYEGDLKAVIGAGATGVRSELTIALDALAAAEDRLENHLRRLARLPTEESLRILLEAREQSRDRVESARRAVDDSAALVEQRARVVERAAAARDAEVRKLAEEDISADRSQRISSHASRARETLKMLADLATGRHTSRIEAYATEALQRLLRKEGLIDAVRIDPKSLQVDLESRTGARLEPALLSAGERQLTALALLWSLTRAAGRPLPVVIDTPLGRLDASHRRHVVERYLPAASHQVVVLSTDTEIDDELLSLLEPHIGEAYHLRYDETHASTRIESGYFPAVVA